MKFQNNIEYFKIDYFAIAEQYLCANVIIIYYYIMSENNIFYKILVYFIQYVSRRKWQDKGLIVFDS